MTYQFRLREEPFEFHAESDEPVELLESDWAEEVWQGEINRSSSDYIRWVQQSLNQILGLRLAVDGDLGSQTRSAIRSFQQRQGLKVDGIVGSQTESALVAAGASPPPGGTVAPTPVTRLANPNVNTPLPRSGPGFYSYKPMSQQYGLPETIQALQAIGSAWQRAHPQDPRIGIGDISLRGGGPMRGHKSHQKGVDVDIWLVRNDGRKEPTRYQSPQYSRAMTQELINRIRANGILRVRYIFFNDPRATGVKPWPNHDNHLHVRFIAPGTPSTSELEELEIFDIELANDEAAFDIELEWEEEINRNSAEYIRWVQQSLNRTMGLRLTVDGIMGPQTRSAIRSFQQQRGLKVDGLVGAETERALIAAGAAPPPTSPTAPTIAPAPATLADLDSFSRSFVSDFIAAGRLVDCADLAIELCIRFGERHAVPVSFRIWHADDRRYKVHRREHFGSTTAFVRYVQMNLGARGLISNTSELQSHRVAVAGDVFLWEYFHQQTNKRHRWGHTQIIQQISPDPGGPDKDQITVAQGSLPPIVPVFRTYPARFFYQPRQATIENQPHFGVLHGSAPRRFNSFRGLF